MATNNVFSAYETAYQQTEKKEPGEFKPLQTGKYQARLIKNEYDSEKEIFEREFQVLTGPYQGKTQRDWIRMKNKDGIINDISLSRIKTEISAFDPDYEALPMGEAVPMFLQATLGLVVNIYVNTKQRTDDPEKFNTSVYINEFVMNGQSVPAGQPQAAMPAAPVQSGLPMGKDIPF